MSTFNETTAASVEQLKRAWKFTANFRQGGSIRIDFFLKHGLQLFLILVLLMAFISSKYQCMTKMEEIAKLEQDLTVVKTERIRERSHYMSRIRESAMQQLVDTVRPGLTIQEQPPFRLTADGGD